ncbi:MAG TPA: OmpA family protein [Crenalkalicoccus sp.]|jgi:opacity protein-like surface antigen|nr:OmpA family protein [Crenalkalicoccus sp.]
MTLRKALLAATLLATPGYVVAQPVTGLYVGAGAGWNQTETADLRPNQLFAPTLPVLGRGRAIYKGGFVGVASLGWGFGNGFRVEVEGNYRQNDFNKLNGFSPLLWAHGNAKGIQSTAGVMVNGFYDFDLSNFGLAPSFIQPYIGVGVGYAWTDWRGVSGTSVSGVRIDSSGTEGNFAWQGIAGAAVPLTQFGVPGLSFTAEYRYFATYDNRFAAKIFADGTTNVVGGTRLKVDNGNHSVLIGLRYAFFQPPPPVAQVAPPPAPAPAPARTYLVFFDWDRADLTARAREIIAEAAQNAQRLQVTRIEVAGHADRSGPADYNLRLSRRRAEAVAAELVRHGIQRNEITIQAFGESRPLVPTADGVREPQNRRVEIVLR